MGTGTKRTPEEEQRIIHDIINRLWKFNKQYITLDLFDDATWDAACSQVDKEFKSTDADFQDFAADLFNASLMQLERIRKDRKANE